MTEDLIRLVDCVMAFDGEIVLNTINLTIRDKEFLTLLGPSGCGKTTTLRLIGGFEIPTSGDVYFDGVRINDVPPHKRRVNTVFQKYALFPHLNVFENVAFGLRIARRQKLVSPGSPSTGRVPMERIPESEIEQRVFDALGLVGLNGYHKRRVHQLSGGQQQRVAIARAIVNKPQVLLLDEPLGALDLKLRQQLQRELLRIQREVGITFIYVTHDQEEALTMSDRIAVLDHGTIEQIGTPVEVYERPATAFVADFIGVSNVIERDGHRITIRPEKITLLAAGDATPVSADAHVEPAIVTDVIYAGVLERVPPSLIEASQDLGGRTWRTTRSVLVPLILPGIVAGSIFTFSLTLGDYITPLLIGGTSANFIGNIIYTNIGIANNVPFAAAMALVPVVIMGIYLSVARALGAFEAL